MKVPVLDLNGKEVEQVELPGDIFEAEVNVGLMHQAYVRQMANARLGTHKVKSRGEVRMTTAKWYRQKGTGRARHGARSAPIFVGGGQAFGPRPRKYTKKMPKKMRREAIRSCLSALLRDDQLVFVNQLTLDTPKTKAMQALLDKLVGGSSALLLLAERNDNVELSANNLPNAMTLRANYLNIRDLLQYDKVIVPLDALELIVSIWGKGA
ncbi:MAG: 50S ribosomal protein L4 [Chloroflexi bacterium]|nr:MAG: 50S ribosomal protein L4 [Phototrophicales bacterium]RMF82410.1 MAG: 50S ribosomal protein L4 [Chloroflexota bacterium]